MKLTVTPLERPSRAKRQGLHYHICVPMDVLSRHALTLVQYLVGQRHIWSDIVLCPTVIFHTVVS